MRYEDETTLVQIAQAYPGATSQVEGRVVATDVVFRPRRTLVSRIEDDSGALLLRFLNFYPSQVKALSIGARVRARGEVRLGHFGPEMVHPRFKVLRVDTPLPTVLTPVYPSNAGVSQDLLRRLAQRALDQTDSAETVPAAMLKRLDLMGYAEAVRVLHNPAAGIDIPSLERHVHPAWRRIKFDELLAQQLSMRRHHARRAHLRAPGIPQQSPRASRLLASLPFRLTASQLKVLREIQHDLSRPHPMQRLLQGDVGCGKTIIAALTALQAVDAGFQVAIMAPTEILAEQHFRKFSGLVRSAGCRRCLVVGKSEEAGTHADATADCSAGASIVIGTHALIQEQVEFRDSDLSLLTNSTDSASISDWLCD